MRALSADEILDLWERGLTQGPTTRALSLLAAACPDMPHQKLLALPIGHRDALLLALREALFGPRLEAVAICPQCGQQLELSFSTAELQYDPASEPQKEVSLDASAYVLQLRPPNSQDVLAATKERDSEQARDTVLRRCLTSVSHREKQVTFDDLPAEVLAAAEEQLAQIDPLADIQINIACSYCDHGWKAAFDVVSFMWAEIEAWVGRVLNEVHTLALAYGWDERSILALSPTRRQIYLDLVGA